MPCEWYKKADGTVVHVNRGRSGGRFHCKFCRTSYAGMVGKLCDFPVGNGHTCDAKMCNSCATTIGIQNLEVAPGFTRLGETVDVCPIHKNQPFPKAEK